MAQKKTVKVKIPREASYDVYKFENGETTLLNTIVTDIRPRELELAKDYGVKKVIVVKRDTITDTYEMPIEEFIKHATKMES